eukprot:m.137830 g.137830  ORF g.137830 m.137830 type:complete len:80 (-) comp13149_c0_seq36:1329-1568(-)
MTKLFPQSNDNKTDRQTDINMSENIICSCNLHSIFPFIVCTSPFVCATFFPLHEFLLSLLLPKVLQHELSRSPHQQGMR